MKRASKPPAYCAGCFQQKPEKRHVDFEAAFDGPSFDTPEVGHGIRMSLDDLVLCEDCITNAANMIGLVDAEELKSENQELGEALEEAARDKEEMKATIDGLRNAQEKLMDERYGKIKRANIRRAKAEA